MKPITFSYQFNLKTYLKITFKRLYQSWAIWIIYIYAILYTYSLIFSDKPMSGDPSVVFPIIIFVVLLLHIAVYSGAKKKFTTSSQAGKAAIWTIDETGIERRNDSYSSQIGWNTIYKITNDKKWVFIYLNKIDFSFFPISIISENDLLEIKRLVYINEAPLVK